MFLILLYDFFLYVTVFLPLLYNFLPLRHNVFCLYVNMFLPLRHDVFTFALRLFAFVYEQTEFFIHYQRSTFH